MVKKNNVLDKIIGLVLLLVGGWIAFWLSFRGLTPPLWGDLAVVEFSLILIGIALFIFGLLKLIRR